MMMFLLKSAFWLGLVLVLLPTGSKKHDAPEIGAAAAASAATSAVSDLSQFCSRQPESCAVGSQVASVLAQRAQDGAIMVYEFVTERREASKGKPDIVPARNTSVADEGASAGIDTTGSIRPHGTPHMMIPKPRPTRSQDTLTVLDRNPAWRKPALRQEARLQGPI